MGLSDTVSDSPDILNAEFVSKTVPKTKEIIYINISVDKRPVTTIVEIYIVAL